MKRWWVFYITVLIAILLNGYFGVYKELWMYAEQINLFGIVVLIGANTLEYFLKKWPILKKIIIVATLIHLAAIVYGIIRGLWDAVILAIVLLVASLIYYSNKDKESWSVETFSTKKPLLDNSKTVLSLWVAPPIIQSCSISQSFRSASEHYLF